MAFYPPEPSLAPAEYDKIKQHALEAYPEEACGVLRKGVYRRVENIAKDPENGFQMPHTVKDYDAIIHSHPDGMRAPSKSDMEFQYATAVPWAIIVVDKTSIKDFFWFGVDQGDLLGRPFRHGVTDCYTLIRDWYMMNRNVELPEFPRDWNWWLEDQNLYMNGFKEAGFEEVTNPQRGDVFISQVMSPVPNHGGIYLGDEIILHHLGSKQPFDPSRLSYREPLGRWTKTIRCWLRHVERNRIEGTPS